VRAKALLQHKASVFRVAGPPDGALGNALRRGECLIDRLAADNRRREFRGQRWCLGDYRISHGDPVFLTPEPSRTHRFDSAGLTLGKA
jgi:hypothetical protein